MVIPLLRWWGIPPTHLTPCRSRILISHAGNVGGGIWEPTSRSNHQTTRVIAASVAAFDELISIECTRNESRGKVARDDGFWVEGTLHVW
jgi:hypothetical protein